MISERNDFNLHIFTILDETNLLDEINQNLVTEFQSEIIDLEEKLKEQQKNKDSLKFMIL